MANITECVHGPEIYDNGKKIALMFLTPKTTDSGDFIDVDLNKFGIKNLLNIYVHVYKLEKSALACYGEPPLVFVNNRIATIELQGKNRNCVRKVVVIGNKF